MSLLHLPAAAAVPLIMGMFTGICGTVAAMAAIPFAQEHMILMAVFSLISHNLIQEGIIQARSGFHIVGATVYRLCASMVTVWIMARFLIPQPSSFLSIPVVTPDIQPLSVLFRTWLLDTLRLTLKVGLIIIVMMILLEIMKAYRLITALTRRISPVLKFLGLDPEVGLLWLVSAGFGLAYGGAVVVQEVRNHSFSPRSINRFHLSAGINHAMIEEPVLFLIMGIPVIWLWLPRLLVAAAAVHLLNISSIIIGKISELGKQIQTRGWRRW